MKFFRLLCAATILYSTSLFASANGGVLTGISPASQAMGGTGVANFTNGTDAMYKNPALLSQLPAESGKTTGELYATYFTQNGSVNYDSDGTGNMKTINSATSGRIAPQIAATYKVNDQWALGLGVLSFGGAVADYSALKTSSTDALHKANGLETSMDLVRIPLAVSWKINDMFSVGAAPFLTYGQMELNYDVTTPGTDSGRTKHGAFGVGGEFGATAKAAGFLFGLAYTTNSNVSYPAILNLDLFGINAAKASGLNNLEIDQPQELAAGVGYDVTSDIRVTVDYRFINWASAIGYRDLGWSDQHVFAVGGQYKLDKLAVRVGYNYGQSPIRSASGQIETLQTMVQGHQVLTSSVTKLNQFLFPGETEHHIGVGAGYQVTSDINIDGSFVISPANTVTRGGSVPPALMLAANPNYEFDSTVSQWSVALGLSYKF